MIKSLNEFEELEVKLLCNILNNNISLSSLDFDIDIIDYIDVLRHIIDQKYVIGLTFVVMSTPENTDSSSCFGNSDKPHVYTEDCIYMMLDNPRLSYNGLKFLSLHNTN